MEADFMKSQILLQAFTLQYEHLSVNLPVRGSRLLVRGARPFSQEYSKRLGP